MTSLRTWTLGTFALCLTSTLACTPPERSPEQVEQADAKAEAGDTAKADAKPAEAKADAKAEAPPADPAERYALTEEDERLIAADPSTLSPEENRKRAHALRKKIMQNPDSEAAKALEDARQAVLAGEVQPTPGNTSEPAPGTDTQGGKVIELPEHLREPADK
ncbi:hypothetical protein PPSIR1_04238 [Plesiocystis pacifica SIR-1]|uniref:Uncharacterized protein n=1 Tax=Plesiocystis pacifica SIR-1 TaxID=391625 RepID=A6GFC9_9BACT|nr:hypothetical protein [Plesiocystis pacifica]EDM75414.1 hypothetical protein PPSIR1_04238 [Plesiocystis pacifica SIR-1]